MMSAKQLKHDLGNALAENVMEYIKDKPKDFDMCMCMDPNPYYFDGDADSHQIRLHYSQRTMSFSEILQRAGLTDQREDRRHLSYDVTRESYNADLYILTLTTSFGSACYHINVKSKWSSFLRMQGMTRDMFNIRIWFFDFDDVTLVVYANGSDDSDNDSDDDSDNDSDDDSDNDP